MMMCSKTLLIRIILCFLSAVTKMNTKKDTHPNSVNFPITPIKYFIYLLLSSLSFQPFSCQVREANIPATAPEKFSNKNNIETG